MQALNSKFSCLKHRRSFFNHARGAALVETAIISGVLMTFMVGIPVLGKIIDVRQTAIQASRYAAWEMTVHADPRTEAARQIDIRFFREMGAPISHGTPDVETNELWGERSEEDAPPPPPSEIADSLINGREAPPENSLFDRNQVTVSNTGVSRTVIDNDYLGQGPLDIADNIGNIVHEVADFIGEDGWKDVEKHGLLKSQVTVSVDAGEMMSSTTLTESTAILVDGWSAAEESDIRDRVHGFVPTARLDSVGRFAYKLGKALPMLKDLKGLRRALGCVNTAVLPPEKLQEGDEPPVLPAYDPSVQDLC